MYIPGESENLRLTDHRWPTEKNDVVTFAAA